MRLHKMRGLVSANFGNLKFQVLLEGDPSQLKRALDDARSHAKIYL